MKLQKFLPHAKEFINEHKEQITQYAEQLKAGGGYNDFNTRLSFDCFYAHKKSERLKNNAELLGQIGTICKISTNLINDNHIFTLYKKALNDCGIL